MDLTKAEKRIVADMKAIGRPCTSRDISNHRGAHWRAACGIGKSLWALSYRRPDVVARVPGPLYALGPAAEEAL